MGDRRRVFPRLKNSMNTDILDIEPFEICSIRPPTENHSLTFRLTRNCYWNKCGYCPVYKLGTKFSRRSVDEVRVDIRRARLMDDFLFDRGFGVPFFSENDFARVRSLVDEINRGRWEAGYLDDHYEGPETELPRGIDERMKWFLTWFKDRPDLEDSLNHILTWRIGGGKTCFLGDADNLIIKPDFLESIIGDIKNNFPAIERFTIYGRTATASRLRSLKDLKRFAAAGLNRIHFGLESGSDRVLDMVNKGETADDHRRGCQKISEAGLSCSVYVMPGLGGEEFSAEHASETASVLSDISPDFVRLRSLEIFPGTPLEEALHAGSFIEASEETVVREIRQLVASIKGETIIYSDSASNLLAINGKLPDERHLMLQEIDNYLGLSDRKKLVFSLKSRLQSFMGQYGGLTEDVYHAVQPMMQSGAVDVSGIGDERIHQAIKLIRGKLMP